MPVPPDSNRPGPSPDFDLWVAWRAGDRGAGLRLFERHYDMVHRFFDTKVGRDVESLVDRTFRACLEPSHTVGEIRRVAVLLLGAARRELYAFLLSEAQAARAEPVDPASMSLARLGGSPAPKGSAEVDPRRAALPRIPLESQLLIELHDDDLLPDELAHVMSQPVAWVHEQLAAAHERLAAEMAEPEPDEVLVVDTLSTLQPRPKLRPV